MQTEQDQDLARARSDALLAMIAVPVTFVGVLVVSTVAVMAAAALSGVDLTDTSAIEGLSQSLAGLVAMVVGTQPVLLVMALAFALASDRPLRERLGTGPGELRGRTAFFLAAGSLFVAWPVELLLVRLGVEPGPNLEGITAILRAHPGFAAVAFSVAPCICEEVFFRGLLQRGLARVARPAVAIGVSAAAFGLMHMDWLQSPVAAVLGAWFGWLAWRSGSIRVAVAAHFINNLVVVLAFSRVEGDDYAELLTHPLFTGISLASAACLVVGLLMLRAEKSRAG